MTTKRSQTLIRPKLQLKLAGWFAAVAGLGMILQFMVFSGHATAAVQELPGDPSESYAVISSALFRSLLLTMGLVLPLIVAVAILSTFRIVGPIYRFSRFLEAVERGERPADCFIRDRDELQDFCELLNRATAPLREGGEGSDAGSEREREAA